MKVVNMDIKHFILNRLKTKGSIQSKEAVAATGFSRAYVNRFFKDLVAAGEIVLIGKANSARYVSAQRDAGAWKKDVLKIRRELVNKGLSEDVVLAEIQAATGIFMKLPTNIASIVDYAFTEILNNAIEHSRSRRIWIFMERDNRTIYFEILDRGVGIYNNIRRKRHLKNELEAIQDLLKGKETTVPKSHSGEGIFFTSKSADTLVIQSSTKKLIFNNTVDDVFVVTTKKMKGTKVSFSIMLSSKRKIGDVFKKYTGPSYEFGKTSVAIRLYEMGTNYVSRSQGRRVVSGLERFKSVVLDFRGVRTVGQGFADEVFRVFKNAHPHVSIIPKNMNETVAFMVKRAMRKG